VLTRDEVLLLMLRFGPGTGEELAERASRRSGGLFSVSRSTHHRAVRRFVEQGFATKKVGYRENTASRGAPGYSFYTYSLTPKGDREVERIRQQVEALLGTEPIDDPS
jgi:DNA-binding PadR family transcriptional regulator